MGNQLSDGEKVVVTVFVALLAAGVAGLFFFGNAILEMKDAISGLQLSMAEMQRDIGDLQEDATALQEEMVSFRAEVSERFDVIEGRLSAMEMTIETHHGSSPRPAN